MSVLQDIPRYYTALAEWSACLLYVNLIGGIKKETKNILLAGIFLIVQTGFLVSTDNVAVYLWIPCMIVAVGLMFGYICLAGQLTIRETGYCCARAFILAEFMASLEWQLCSFGWKLLFGQNILARGLLLTAVYVLCILVMYYLEKPLITAGILKQVTWKETGFAVGIAALIFAFSNLSYLSVESPFSASILRDIFNVRTLVDLVGIAVLHAYQSRICEYTAEKELAAINLLLRSQYDQYRNYQDSLDLIHMKYHDLKHQIAGLRAETDEQKRKDWLDVMEEEISAFESLNKTGNQVLDTILAAKIFHCRRNKIQISCVADGKLLDFMHVTDICSIFGNALDNAIESVILLPEEEKRLIHLTVSAKKNFVFIKVENYCEEKVEVNEHGILPTSKADKDNHGFGIKSICYAVQKYDGSVNFGVKNNWFELSILIPLT